jgi:hypothetical protein
LRHPTPHPPARHPSCSGRLRPRRAASYQHSTPHPLHPPGGRRGRYDLYSLDNFGRAVNMFPHMSSMIKLDQAGRLYWGPRALGGALSRSRSRSLAPSLAPSLTLADSLALALAPSLSRLARSLSAGGRAIVPPYPPPHGHRPGAEGHSGAAGPPWQPGSRTCSSRTRGRSPTSRSASTPSAPSPPSPSTRVRCPAPHPTPRRGHQKCREMAEKIGVQRQRLSCGAVGHLT